MYSRLSGNPQSYADDSEYMEVMDAPDSADRLYGSVELGYISSWENVYMYYSFDGYSWEEQAMVRIRDTLHVGYLDVDAGGLVKFVLHNGEGDWDNPPGGGNYELGAGQYILAFGELRQSSMEEMYEVR